MREGRIFPNSADFLGNFFPVKQRLQRGCMKSEYVALLFDVFFRPPINKDAFSESKSLIHQRQKEYEGN